ncbi:MAG: hypothetical protein QW153_01465 [Candidatus Bilamarchaeaceae archaeon]
MAHKNKVLGGFETYISILSVVCDKKTLYERIPLAERAYSLAKGEDKDAAFLATLLTAVPKSKENAVLNLLIKRINGSSLTTIDVLKLSKIMSEVRIVEVLEEKELRKEELKIYEDKILKNEISVATLISRIVLAEANIVDDPKKTLYVYAAIAEVIDPPTGKKLREKAVEKSFGLTLKKIKRELEVRKNDLEKTIENLKVLLGVESCEVEMRIKSPESATLKLEEKGYINDLIGTRLVFNEVKEAVETAKKIISNLKNKGKSPSVDDYYSKPKQSGYRGFNINFNLNDISAEIQISDEETRKKIEETAPHGLHKSYGVLSMAIVDKFKRYL